MCVCGGRGGEGHFWISKRGQGLRGAYHWLRLSDVKGLLWISKRQVFQLMPEIGWLGRIRPFPCGKTSPASGIIRGRASENQ